VGSLPMGNVWRMDAGEFAFMGSLDTAPAPLRRVWAMAVYQGQLFAGTLPSGRVRSLEAGKMVTWDCAFPNGWHHVAAVRDESRLRLYVDGAPVAASTPFDAPAYDLSTRRRLTIGFGVNEHFEGLMSDLRLYDRALGAGEVAALAAR